MSCCVLATGQLLSSTKPASENESENEDDDLRHHREQRTSLQNLMRLEQTVHTLPSTLLGKPGKSTHGQVSVEGKEIKQ